MTANLTDVRPGTSYAQVINPSLPHDDYGPQVNLTIWVLSGMALGWLTLRVYCKFIRSRQLWWDDYVLIASWLTLLAGDACISFAISYGFGKHNWDVKPANFPFLLLVSNFAGTFLIIGAAWSKTSFAITLLRISSGWQKKLVWIIIPSVNLILGVSGLITWIRCSPLEKVWRWSTHGTCWPYRYNIYYNIFTAAYSGVMDIVLALLPWNILWGLSINKKEKISAMAAMSMGIFAGITSFVKIYAIQDSGNIDIVDTVQLVVLGTAEIAVTIMAASVPILRALARDKSPQPGPFLALDETENWATQRSVQTSDVPSSPPPVPELTEADRIEMQPPTRRDWNLGKLQLRHLSQIEESEEATDRGSRRNAWGPI